MKNAIDLVKSRKIYKVTLIACFSFFCSLTVLIYFGKNIAFFSNDFDYLPLTNYAYKIGSNFLIYLVPIVCSIYITDLSFFQKQMSAYIFTRISRRKYEYIYLLVSFLVSFSILFFIIFCIEVIANSSLTLGGTYFKDNYLLLGFENPLIWDLPFAKIYVNNPLAYQILYAFLNSLYGGLIGMLSYAISLFIKKRYQVTLSMFMISLLWIPVIRGLPGGTYSLWYPHVLFLANPPLPNDPGFFTIENGILFWIVILLIIPFVLVEVHLRKEEF